MVAAGKYVSTQDWPLSETAVLDLLTKVMLSRMDQWSLSSLSQRLKQPGRLVIAPALFLPILLIQARKMLSSKFSAREKGVEIGLTLYMMLLILIVQEVTREEG
jgi:hypothetical protein